MRRLRAWRALARVELRALRRNPARSALVAALVAVPVAALAGGGALLETTLPTLAERRAQELGRAALRVDATEACPPDEVLALLPGAARVEAIVPGRLHLGAPASELPALALDVHGLAAGMLRVVDGRAPSAPGEVALSPQVAAQPGADLVLTGRVVAPEATRSPLALLAPGTSWLGPPRRWLVDVPDEGAARALAARLRGAGAAVLARHEIAAGDGFESVVLFVVGGFAFFEAALVVAAAFAVGVRRRRREVGLLGATGATPADVTLAIVASAAVLALAGCALGLAVGVAGSRALHPFLDGWNGRLNGPLELSLPHLAGAAALGLGSAVVAAALPALGVARLPVRVALGGRRPVAGSGHGWLRAGVLSLALGLLLLTLAASGSDAAAGVGVLGGSVLAVLGLGACSPWLLGALARAAGPLPLAWRLAVRDAGRFRARNGPVVTAVLAALSISVLVATLVHTVERSTGAARSDRGWLLAMVGLCAATGLAVVWIATALSSVESAADARVLRTLGASPRLLRAHAANRAAYLATLGSVLALPAGLVPAAGLLRLANVELSFAVPWATLIAGLAAFPAATFALTSLSHRHSSEILR